MPVRGKGYRYRDRSRFRYRLLRLTVVYIVIAAAAAFTVLFVLNGNASAQAEQQKPQPTPIATSTPAPTPTSPYAIKINGVPKDTKDFYFSFDGKYCMYQSGASLTVLDVLAGSTLKTIDDPSISWAQFINNRDIVLYMTQQGNSVAVNTSDVVSGAQVKQTSITVPANSKVKSAAFSSAKNYLCVNVETGTDSFSDEVYTVDIMKQTTRLTLQDIINNMVMPQRTEQVYYTNNKGTLYFGNKAVSNVGVGTLLGPDGKDKIYFQLTADRSTVNVVADGKLEKSISLPDISDLVRFFRTDSNMYAVYDGFLVDLSGDATAQIPFDKGLDFVGIGGKNVFFRNASGEILGIALLA
jgi:hypothetical protein